MSVKRPHVSRRLSHPVSYGWIKAVANPDKTRISSATRIWRYGSFIIEPASVTASFLIITIASHATTTPERLVEYPIVRRGSNVRVKEREKARTRVYI